MIQLFKTNKQKRSSWPYFQQLKLVGILSILLATMASCSSDESTTNLNKELSVETDLTEYEISVLGQVFNKKHHISVKEAQNEVENFVNTEIKSGGKTNQRTIKSLEVMLLNDEIKKNYSKTTLPDTLAYVFNFSDELGYVIFAADNRVSNPIMNFVEKGYYDGKTDNPGLLLFLETAENKIATDIGFAQKNRDSLAEVITRKLEKQFDKNGKSGSATTDYKAAGFAKSYTITVRRTEIGPWYMTENVEPLIPVEWGQGYPFNSLVRYKNGCSNAPAGCVATATGQIMAYWKYPYHLDGYYFNWDEFITYGDLTAYTTPNIYKTQVAELMERIGFYSQMNYGCNASGAKTHLATAFLRNKCYYSGGHKEGYSFNRTLQSLKLRQPVLIEGFTAKTNNTASVGHAWVVDGYRLFTREVKEIVEYRDAITGNLVSGSFYIWYDHYNYLGNNWGWNGSGNGWYEAGVFSVYGSNFQNSISIFPFIKR
ncbi:C10 family peptidase [Flavobacterium sp. HSC-61S13]|uniref:C10 family peptidase n=1 Tax=Flavobacterium sp. HSC-61S13 TaxID=2910963 RepID=UPI0020A08434|nr:C10 family peptidase [Flavobacterium sp. HSC-61S13]MCP1995155.1 hypothetical protein [Flavobacterium sp. HSC-61S13]